VLELSVSGNPLVEGTAPAHFSKNRVRKTTMQDFHVYRKLTHFLQRITSLFIKQTIFNSMTIYCKNRFLLKNRAVGFQQY
jgi:hypothetical protein